MEKGVKLILAIVKGSKIETIYEKDIIPKQEECLKEKVKESELVITWKKK